MLVGAAIGFYSKNIGIAFLFGLASHYLIDILPHWEYLSEVKISKKSDAVKIFSDFIFGLLAVLFLIWGYPEKAVIVSFAIFGSLLPDISCFLYKTFKSFRFLKIHYDFHYKIHYLKYLSFWQGLPATLFVIVISIFLIWG